MAQYELDLRDYGRIVIKRKKIIVFATILVGLLTFILTPEPKSYYKARSTVRISQSSTVAGLFLQAISYSRWNNMETQAKIIRSFPIISKTAQRLGIIDSSLTMKEIANNKNYLKTLYNLTESVYAAQSGKTDIIEIITTASRENNAMDFANVLAEVFIEESIKEKNKRIDDAANFIKRQLELYEEKLLGSEQKLEKFKRDNMGAIPVSNIETYQLEEKLFGIMRTKKDLEIQLDQLRRRLKSSIGSFIDWVSSAGDVRNDPSMMELNNRLISLQVEKETLLIYHTDSSPEVQDLETQIQKIITDVITELEGQLAEMEAEEAGLLVRLDAFPSNDMLFKRLEREVKDNEEIYSMLRQRYQEAQIKQSERITETNLVEFATYAKQFTSSGKWSKTFLGVVIGLILGLVIAFVAETLDTSIGAIEDVEEFLKLPVLGVIPHFDTEAIKERIISKHPDAEHDQYIDMYTRLITQFRPKSPMAESYRTLRTNLEFARMKRDGGNVFLFTSASMLEGKSTTIINLGITLAQMGHRTLLVGCNLRRPTLYKIFGLDAGPGIKDIMLSQAHWRNCVRSINDIILGKMSVGDELLRTAGWDRLFIITSGGIYPNPSEILSSPKMAEFLREVQDEFDMVLVDCPPILPVTDAAILGSRVDGCILIYQVGKVPRGALRRAKQHLEAVNARVWGVVLNDFKAEIAGFQEGTYYGKYYGEGSEKGREKYIEGRKFRLFRTNIVTNKIKEVTSVLKPYLEKIRKKSQKPSEEKAGELEKTLAEEQPSEETDVSEKETTLNGNMEQSNRTGGSPDHRGV